MTFHKSAIIVALFLAFTSCQKSALEKLEQHNVRIEVDSVIRINQAILLIDTDWITDSIHYVESRPGRLYRWKTIPDNGCVEFSGHHKTGLAVAQFKCAGNYVVSADIYDESGVEKLASTIPIVIQVTSKILTPTTPIHKEDTLIIRASPVSSYGPLFDPNVTPTTKRWIQLLYSTSKAYEHSTTTRFEIDSSSSTSDQYNFVLRDSLKLYSYPFAHWTGKFSEIDGSLDLYNFQPGIPKPITITWLGKKYS
ncbi:hypothetical protein [Flavitalea sp.]|nr:hypothetical protein [Flavitalea sp.]